MPLSVLAQVVQVAFRFWCAILNPPEEQTDSFLTFQWPDQPPRLHVAIYSQGTHETLEIVKSSLLRTEGVHNHRCEIGTISLCLKKRRYSSMEKLITKGFCLLH